MPKNPLIFILVFGFVLLFSLPVFGAVSYSRMPAGDTIPSPVNFDISFDDFSETGLTTGANCEGNTCGFWSIGIKSTGADFWTYGDCLASSTHSFIFSIPLPVYIYTGVQFMGYLDDVCSGVYEGGAQLEFLNDESIFEIIEAPAPAGYFPSNFATSVFSFASETLYDLRVILYILVGLALGMGIILIILDLFENKK